MKPLSPQTRRIFYFAIIGLALAALLVAVIDHFTATRRLQGPVLGVVIILLILEVALLAYTELLPRMKGAAQPEPLAAADAAFDRVEEATSVEPATGPWTAPAPDELVPTRVLCAHCHSLFIHELTSDRPVLVTCPSCKTQLNLTRKQPVQDWATVPCVECRTDNRVPAMPGLTAFTCVSCGHRQDVSLAPVGTADDVRTSRGTRKPRAASSQRAGRTRGARTRTSRA